MRWRACRDVSGVQWRACCVAGAFHTRSWAPGVAGASHNVAGFKVVRDDLESSFTQGRGYLGTTAVCCRCPTH
eukprot:357519-Chlamydomonas_euryale.AAC.2